MQKDQKAFVDNKINLHVQRIHEHRQMAAILVYM